METVAQDRLSFGVTCLKDLVFHLTSQSDCFGNARRLTQLLDGYRGLPEFAGSFFATSEKITKFVEQIKGLSVLVSFCKILPNAINFSQSFYCKNKFSNWDVKEVGGDIQRKPLEEQPVWFVLQICSNFNTLLGNVKTVTAFFSISHKFISPFMKLTTPLSVLGNVSTIMEELGKMATGLNHKVSINSKSDKKETEDNFTAQHVFLSMCIVTVNVNNLVFISLQFFLPSFAGARLLISTISFLVSITKSLIEARIEKEAIISIRESFSFRERGSKVREIS